MRVNERVRNLEAAVIAMTDNIGKIAWKQVAFGVTLDCLHDKGVVTREEVNERTAKIFEQIREEAEAIGKRLSEQGQETVRESGLEGS